MTDRLTSAEVWGPERKQCQRRGFAFWVLVAFYLFLLLPQVPAPGYDHSLREQYLNVGLVVRISAAACVFLLLRRDARARWFAVAVVGGSVLNQIAWAWAFAHYGWSGYGWWLCLGLASIAVFVILARHVFALFRKGFLR